MAAIAVLGAGAWGTALANSCARGGREVVLWGRDADAVRAMEADRENAARLPGVKLEPGVRCSANLAAALEAELVLAVAPAQSFRALAGAIRAAGGTEAPLVVCAKGIEEGTGLFLTQVAREIAPGGPCAILSGPSFARDVACGMPTAVVLAAERIDLAREAAALLSTQSFRVYHSSDVRGVEIGGAAKNVLAIACGIAAGRKLGASALAALVARGFAELRRYGAARGARPETLMGLSGLGDLVLTCGSAQSRNFSLGLALGQGASLAAARGGKLAEGMFTAPVLVETAKACGVEMPVAEAVAAVLDQRLGVAEAIERLLARPLKEE